MKTTCSQVMTFNARLTIFNSFRRHNEGETKNMGTFVAAFPLILTTSVGLPKEN